jgi:quercetin dioxygenase-like cupin family protein
MFKPSWAAGTLVAALVLANPIAAQQSAQTSPSAVPNIKRIPLQRFDVPGTPFETVIGIAEIGPGVAIGRHNHPGPESGYVMEGGFELLIDGEPPRLLKAGDSYKVPPRAIHDAKAGPQGARVIATYVVEKGEPLAAAAPQ